MPNPPLVECDQVHAGLAVDDLDKAIEYYTTRLGFTHAFSYGEPPGFAGVNLGKVQIFLDKGTPKPSPETGAVYFMVGDVDALYEFHRSTGVEIAEELCDQEYGIRNYTVRDLNGYYLVFGQHIFNTGEPLVIERVEVTMRIERRLAALLEDLAKHKRMTLGSCIEEMVLHTNEDVGPHTKATLRYIQELRQKHGIDYDCHASYRFTER